MHYTKETKELFSKIRLEYLASNKNFGRFKNVKWYETENLNHKKYVVKR